MHLINDRPWVDLSSFTDHRGLWDREPLVAASIAKSMHAIMPCIVGTRKNLLLDDLELGDLSRDPTVLERYGDLVQGMSVKQLFTFMKYAERSTDLALMVPIRGSLVKGDGGVRAIVESYANKHLASYTSDSPVRLHWNWFFDWLAPLNVFREIGRVALFLNERGQATSAHRDYPDGVSRRDQFIFLTSSRKRFWVGDGESRHYLTSPVATFDNANYHGSDAPEYPTWSLRVDGLFTESFLKRTGLQDHYAPER